MGGAGTGAAFRGNLRALSRIKIKRAESAASTDPDTRTVLFGISLAAPVLTAPLAGVAWNMGGGLTELEYVRRVLAGAAAAKVLGMTGDGVDDRLFGAAAAAISHMDSRRAIAVVKPWTGVVGLEKLRAAEAAGAVAVGVDIDAARMPSIWAPGRAPLLFDGEVLAPYVEATRLPFIVKGVLSVQQAVIARDAGAAGIVVSNHGGRISDKDPAPADLLPAIAEAVGSTMTVMADGGVRSGADVLRLVALGADAVLVGRPIAIAAFGGGGQAVGDCLGRIRDELADAMRFAGRATLDAIDRDVVALDPVE